MRHILKRPFEKETLDDWAKLSVDIAKVAILALPVILYGDSTIGLKAVNILSLCGIIYGSILSARHLRKMKEGINV